MEPPIIVNLHDLRLAFQTSAPPLRKRFEVVYGHLPRSDGSEYDLLIDWQLHQTAIAPFPPPNSPVISAGELVSYYGTEAQVIIRMPKYGLMSVDLDRRRLIGMVTPNCLDVYGAFEDVMMISLAPLYRRRGWFPLHAFAALSPQGQVALITGQRGSGKTTTGLALLSAGWKLLSNDSPLLTIQKKTVKVLAYPGRLSAYDDSLAWFDHLKNFIPADSLTLQDDPPPSPNHHKRVFRAEEAFKAPWASSGPAGGIFFPQVVPGLKQSELVELAPKEALLQLMPQAIEGWDKLLIAANLQLLNRLVDQAPCYTLRLSPHVPQLPPLIATGMATWQG